MTLTPQITPYRPTRAETMDYAETGVRWCVGYVGADGFARILGYCRSYSDAMSAYSVLRARHVLATVSADRPGGSWSEHWHAPDTGSVVA